MNKHLRKRNVGVNFWTPLVVFSYLCFIFFPTKVNKVSAEGFSAHPIGTNISSKALWSRCVQSFRTVLGSWKTETRKIFIVFCLTIENSQQKERKSQFLDGWKWVDPQTYSDPKENGCYYWTSFNQKNERGENLITLKITLSNGHERKQ